MERISVKCPAKINLFFNIVGLDDRSYHLVHGLNQSISLYDILLIEKSDDITLTCNNDLIPLDEKNSVYKAAKMFFSYTKINSGVKIHIEKNIPLEAGLGGESTDAAGVFVGLNELFNTNLTLDELASLGYKVGCDVPFCIYGGSKEVSGCGEVVKGWNNEYKNYLVVTPNYGFSTKQAFKKYDDYVDSYKVIDTKIGHNDFHTILDDEIKQLISELSTKFNCISMLTGSGSSIICIFNDLKGLEGAYDSLENDEKFIINKAFSCDGILLKKF